MENIFNRSKSSLLLLIVFCAFSSSVKGQQDAQHTQYMYNMNIINPAYAGSNPGTLNIGLMGRTQWVNIPGAPNTATFSIHKPITDHVGLGLSVLADKIGPINEQFIFADFSYTIPMGYYTNLAFGLKGGITLLDANLVDIQTFLPDDESFSQNINRLKPNFGAGVFLYNDTYYVGVSVPGILQTEYLEKEGNLITNVSKTNYLFITGGYVFEINYDWKFKPSVLAKLTQGSPLSLDLAANFLYDETFELGASYRWGDSVNALFNVRIGKKLRVGYSYDFTTSGLRKFNSGTHEVFLLFDIVTVLEILSPRFF